MIKLSKKGDYGLKTILFLAEKKGILIKIQEISKELGISEAFLRRIINDLERGGIINTIKGRNGGVILEKDLKKISLYDIFISLKEDLGIKDCTSGKDCKNIDKCNTTKTLNLLQKGFNSILKMYNLSKITKQN